MLHEVVGGGDVELHDRLWCGARSLGRGGARRLLLGLLGAELGVNADGWHPGERDTETVGRARANHKALAQAQGEQERKIRSHAVDLDLLAEQRVVCVRRLARAKQMQGAERLDEDLGDACCVDAVLQLAR